MHPPLYSEECVTAKTDICQILRSLWIFIRLKVSQEHISKLGAKVQHQAYRLLFIYLFICKTDFKRIEWLKGLAPEGHEHVNVKSK